MNAMKENSRCRPQRVMRPAAIQLLESPIPTTTTTSVKWRYLGNQAWYYRSAGVKTTGKILNKKIKKKNENGKNWSKWSKMAKMV